MTTFHHGESISSWMQSVEMPTFSPLNRDLEVEVCVIGGGLAGLFSAYMLACEGKKVCVLESFEIGSGQTARTTAHFTYMLDERYQRLEALHGEKNARLAAQSHLAAIKKITEVIKKEHIECDMEKVNGYLFNSIEDDNGTSKIYETLNNELEAILKTGLLDVHITERVPLEPYHPGPALCFPDQLQLNPLKLLKGLAEKIIAKGGEIYCHSHVVSVKGGRSAYAKLQNEKIVKCDSLIIASNSPFNDLVAIHTKQASYRSYVIGFEVPKASLVKGLYWDMCEPYHYIRLEKNGDSEKEILLIGGADHKTGQNSNPVECYEKLEHWARKRFPRMGRALYKWSGHVIEPFDRLAYIGHNPMDSENVYVITGHSGNGMTYCTIGGMLITDLIMGRTNPWEALYSPSRIRIASAKTYIKENANVLAQYKDWFVEPQFEDLEENFVEGEGIVYRDGMQIVAAYKDMFGNLELHSAVCTHLGGIVHWNTAEKTWDCPCHGSSFDCHGKVIKGPANIDLAPVEKEAVVPPDTIKVWDTSDATPVV